ncbi:ABC transporter ATP-binding protein [Aquamicrobium sp. LC103]|nr:ABC transporter ATP-binding protein [Aquamicrobium sp. LC103]
MRATKLRVNNLKKQYGQLQALRPTSLEVGNGEFLTLLGPSGSGKTTLLMMVAGLTAPTSGEIWIDGRIATDLPPQKRDIGVVFQNYALFPHLSVYENVAFPLRMRRLDNATIDREVKRLLDIVELSKMADRLPRELSGGQQQRVALARCAVYGPSIILMDEPLGALDKKLRDQMQMEIRHLHKRLGATVLYVTHDQGEAMTMSDRICLMRDGGIEQLGTPAELYHQPRNRFVADFLGGATFLKGTIAGEDEDFVIVEQHGQAPFKALRPVSKFTKGEAVQCMIRPQNLSVSRGQSAGLNVLSATVTDSVMTGTMTEHHVRLADATTVVAVEFTTASSLPRQKGESVQLTWRPADTISFVGSDLK